MTTLFGHHNDTPADLLENSGDVLRFVAEATVTVEQPLSESARQGLYLVLAGVEQTIDRAREQFTRGDQHPAA